MAVVETISPLFPVNISRANPDTFPDVLWSRNHRTELDNQLNKMAVAVTENGKRVRKRKSGAVIIAQQVNKALAGDLKAAQFITEQMVKYGLLAVGENEPTILTSDEASVFEDVVRCIHAANATSGPSGPSVNDDSGESPITYAG